MIEQDKLFEVIGQNFEYRDNDGLEEFVRSDKDGQKEFVYRYFKDDSGEHMDLMLRVKDRRGVWIPVLVYTEFIDNQEIKQYVKAACFDDTGEDLFFFFDPRVFYDDDGSREVSTWALRAKTAEELGPPSLIEGALFPGSQVPEKLDVGLTAALFKRQVINGDFGRPILVSAVQ